MQQRLVCLVSLGCALATTSALAQPAEPAPPDLPQASEPAPVRLPDIDDPMLQQLPAAPKTLSSWQQALKLVRSRNTTLSAQVHRVSQAKGQARQALARALPSLSANANVQRHLLLGEGPVPPFDTVPIQVGAIPDPATTWQAGLSLRVPLLAPQVWYDLGTAEHAVELAELNTNETERVLLGNLAEAIVSVITAERLLEVSQVALESSLSTLDLNRRRARLGAANAVDVLRAEQEAALARSQVVQAAEGLMRAREALGLALGSSESWGVAERINIDDLTRDAAQTCKVEPSIDKRPDVRAARANVALAERSVESVDRSYWPNVDLTSNLTYSPHDQFTPNREHVTWTLGGVFTWQLYDGGLRQGLTQANRASRAIAEEQLTQTRRQARVEVQRAKRGVRVARTNLEVSQRSRDLARETSRLAKIAFLNGSGTSFELVDTSRRLREAELDLAIKEFELIRAQIAALLALASCKI